MAVNPRVFETWGEKQSTLNMICNVALAALCMTLVVYIKGTRSQLATVVTLKVLLGIAARVQFTNIGNTFGKTMCHMHKPHNLNITMILWHFQRRGAEAQRRRGSHRG